MAIIDAVVIDIERFDTVVIDAVVIDAEGFDPEGIDMLVIDLEITNKKSRHWCSRQTRTNSHCILSTFYCLSSIGHQLLVICYWPLAIAC